MNEFVEQFVIEGRELVAQGLPREPIPASDLP